MSARRSEASEFPLVSWELALGIRTSPALVWAAVSGTALGSFLGLRWLGETPLFHADSMSLEPSALAGFTLSVLLGYMFFANAYLWKGTQRILERTGVALHDQPVTFRPTLVKSRYAGAVGALSGVILVMTVPGSYGLDFARADLDYYWFLCAMPFLLWMMFRGALFTVVDTRARDGIERQRIDLLDMKPLRAFGRMGLHGAFVWLVGVSLALPLVLSVDPALDHGGPVVALAIAVAAASLLLPVRALRRSIQRAKREELARVEPALHKARDAALAGDPAQQGRLADLLAYRAYVEQIHEWPFDGSTLLRFCFYLLIPIGSWVAGALVERLVDAVLA